MNDDIEFSFPSSDDAVECMRAINGIADWEIVAELFKMYEKLVEGNKMLTAI